MKSHLLLTFISLSLLCAGCASSGSTVLRDNRTIPEGSVQDDMDVYRNLSEYLHRVPGVKVWGSGNNVTVTIRGINSVNLGITPLYVLDGQAIGTSYSEANNLINPRDIDHVRVLKGNDAAIYGIRGANGVVEIITKRI